VTDLVAARRLAARQAGVAAPSFLVLVDPVSSTVPQNLRKPRLSAMVAFAHCSRWRIGLAAPAGSYLPPPSGLRRHQTGRGGILLSAWRTEFSHLAPEQEPPRGGLFGDRHDHLPEANLAREASFATRRWDGTDFDCWAVQPRCVPCKTSSPCLPPRDKRRALVARFRAAFPARATEPCPSAPTRALDTALIKAPEGARTEFASRSRRGESDGRVLKRIHENGFCRRLCFGAGCLGPGNAAVSSIASALQLIFAVPSDRSTFGGAARTSAVLGRPPPISNSTCRLDRRKAGFFKQESST